MSHLYETKSFQTFLFRYDFDSVMHYRAKAFSTNGDDTIVPKNASIVASRLGQRDGFSPIDRNQINKAYKVPTCLLIITLNKQ